MSALDARSLQDLFDRQSARFPAIRRQSAAERRVRLRKLRAVVASHRDDLKAALQADFGKPETETDLTEYLTTQAELDDAIRHLGRWMKPRRVPTPWMLFGTRSEIRREPKGVVLVISPWNYPFYLALSPLVAALAAGNCVILKPSELTPQTSALIARLVSEVFPSEEVAVVEGGKDTATALLELPFRHVFFTGSPRVGQVVLQAAARHLTTVTLELGGKSPVLVDTSADLPRAAARIAWGKCLNAGQTCIAPDYAFVPESLLTPFVREYRASLERFFGPNPTTQLQSPDLASLVSEDHLRRLLRSIEESVQAGARLEFGGQSDPARRRLAPALLTGVTHTMPIMQEEIFGPILPVITYRQRTDVYDWLRSQPKPLACYVFADDQAVVEEALRETSAGGTAVNNTVLQVANPALPFGGDGWSGHGKYHGEHGFLAFSNERAVLRQRRPDISPLLHPPYTPAVRQRLAWMVRLFG